jgi:hypothetical protein
MKKERHCWLLRGTRYSMPVNDDASGTVTISILENIVDLL